MAVIYQIQDTSGNLNDMACAGQGYGICNSVNQQEEQEDPLVRRSIAAVSMTGYVNIPNSYVFVLFNVNVPSGCYMNINSKGAFPIIRKGTNIGGDVIKSGMFALFYFDGGNYRFVTYDPHDIIGDIETLLAAI